MGAMKTELILISTPIPMVGCGDPSFAPRGADPVAEAQPTDPSPGPAEGAPLTRPTSRSRLPRAASSFRRSALVVAAAPYRQRLYVVEGIDATTARSRVFEANDPSPLVGLCDAKTRPALAAGDFVERIGCSVEMHWTGAHFEGHTPDARWTGSGFVADPAGARCPSSLNGASFAMSEITQASQPTPWRAAARVGKFCVVRRMLLAVLFSGSASLVYQVAWTRRVASVTSATVTAQATVLAVFEHGLRVHAGARGRPSRARAGRAPRGVRPSPPLDEGRSRRWRASLERTNAGPLGGSPGGRPGDDRAHRAAWPRSWPRTRLRVRRTSSRCSSSTLLAWRNGAAVPRCSWTIARFSSSRPRAPFARSTSTVRSWSSAQKLLTTSSVTPW